MNSSSRETKQEVEETDIQVEHIIEAPLAPETVAEDENYIKRRLAKFGLSKLFDAGVEARGIERVPDSEREEKHSSGLLLLWFSVNIVLAVIPVGMLGPQIFELTFSTTVATTFGFATIGAAGVGFVATLGPQLGMRTMVITRYSFGYWGGTIIAIINTLTLLGFSTVSTILAGQVLHNVNNNIPLVVGVILIGVISVTICFIGYNFLHYYERYAWVIMMIIFIMIYVLGGHEGYDLSSHRSDKDTSSRLRAAGVLSFGGIMFSSSIGWSSMAADFNCRLPADTSEIKLFLMTFFGILIPIIFVTALGAALMTVPKFADAWQGGDAAGVVAKVFEPWGRGGDLLLVLLALSVITSNSPNTYSTGLSMQTLFPFFRRFPRAFFTVFAFLIYTIAGVAGREHFSSILKNFLSILGYWEAFWVIILFEEHIIFRTKYGMLGGYDLNAYDSPRRLPVGCAAIFASLGGVAGIIVAMAQAWYVGPIAAKFGPLGGDMGWEFAAVFAGVLYPPLRYLEIRIWKR